MLSALQILFLTSRKRVIATLPIFTRSLALPLALDRTIATAKLPLRRDSAARISTKSIFSDVAICPAKTIRSGFTKHFGLFAGLASLTELTAKSYPSSAFIVPYLDAHRHTSTRVRICW